MAPIDLVIQITLVVLGVVNLVVLIRYTKYTWSLAETSKESLSVARDSLEVARSSTSRAFAPYVEFSVEIVDHALYGVVRNHGLTSAREISIEVTPPLEVKISAEAEHFPIGKDAAFSLGAGQSLRSLLGSGWETLKEENLDQRYCVRIEYKDAIDDRKFAHENFFSLRPLARIRPGRSHDHEQTQILGHIQRHLAEIAKTLDRRRDG